MPTHLQRELEELKKNLLVLGAKVENTLRQAKVSIEDRNAGLAQQIIDNDFAIDQMEVEIEEECLKLLALYQPVAVDLRFIVTALKINNDLERIGDLTVNIAERSKFLAEHKPVDVPFDFDAMARKTQAMLKQSLDALVNMDCELAHQVCAADSQVDAINREMYGQVKEGIVKHPEWIEALIHLLSVSRHVERIADHATNIAEDVIYMVEGQIVRHKAEDYDQ